MLGLLDFLRNSPCYYNKLINYMPLQLKDLFIYLFILVNNPVNFMESNAFNVNDKSILRDLEERVKARAHIIIVNVMHLT